jgi:hypothetical protein
MSRNIVSCSYAYPYLRLCLYPFLYSVLHYVFQLHEHIANYFPSIPYVSSNKHKIYKTKFWKSERDNMEFAVLLTVYVTGLSVTSIICRCKELIVAYFEVLFRYSPN